MSVRPKIIYFIKSAVASEKEVLDSRKYAAADLVYRYAQLAKTGLIEKCDAVAGCVPSSYAHFPKAEDKYEIHEVKPLVEKAPKVPVNKQNENKPEYPVNNAQSVPWVANK